jgi:hypothetical protein
MAAFIPALIAAASSVASSYASGQGSRGQTGIQKSQQKLIDQLLASLQGGGPYSHLFEMDEDAFQKSYVEPAKHKFNTQIAPQIQQQYIATGQQQGSGLQDSLTRAGVDLDQLLNQQYYNFQQDAKNRQQNLMTNILGFSGGQYQPTAGQDIMSGIGGYLASPDWAKQSEKIFNTYYPRKGFDTTASGAVGAAR